MVTAAPGRRRGGVGELPIVGTWFGYGIADLAVILDPGHVHHRRWVSYRANSCWNQRRRPTSRGERSRSPPTAAIVMGRLGGDEAGIIGAADLPATGEPPPPAPSFAAILELWLAQKRTNGL
jgi:hypothetical protein